MSNLKPAPQENQVLVQSRDNLLEALSNDHDYVASLTRHTDPGEFKAALEELAANSYLMEKIPASQIVRAAAQAASMGLSINPYHKECYILPFSVKGKGMVASIVTSKQGVQEMAFNAGFFFDVDPVWNLGGEPKKESEMNLMEKADLDESDPKFFNKFMLGWNFKISDISGSEFKVPDQEAFVSLKAAKAVTQAMQAPDHSLKQAYVHKAIRRAMTEFYIPRQRNSAFMELIKIDDDNAIDVEVVEKKQSALSAAPSDTKEVTAILTQLSNTNTELDMSPLHTKIAGMDASEGKTKLIAAYRDRLKAIRKSPALPATKTEEKPAAKKPKSAKKIRPTFAVINQSINDAKAPADVDNAIADLSHLPADQQAELRTSAENQKHVLSQ